MAVASLNSPLFNVLRIFRSTFSFLTRGPFMCECTVRILRWATGDNDNVTSRIYGLLCIFRLFMVLRSRVLRAFHVTTSKVRGLTRLKCQMVASSRVRRFLAFRVSRYTTERLFARMVAGVFRRINCTLYRGR